MSWAELKLIWNRYEVLIITVIGIILTVIVTIIIDKPTFQIIFELGLTSTIICLLLIVLFTVLKLRGKINAIEHVLQTQNNATGGIYWERQKHFTVEKEKLAEHVVKTILPRLIKQIHDENPKMQTLNIVLDSGTTITPIFSWLIKSGIKGYENDSIKFYTNNLAGIDQIHKLASNTYAINERDFTLLGGQPLNTYRATTGLTLENFKEAIGKNRENQEGLITIGVLTANWFTIEAGYDNISLCARGEGHFEFKNFVIENSEYMLLVAPLGKIIPTNITILNNQITKGQEEYKSIEIPPGKKAKTFLLTTLRPHHCKSPIIMVSNQLESVKKNNSSENYTLVKDCPIYLPEGDKYDIIVAELPHQYTRDCFSELYGGTELSGY